MDTAGEERGSVGTGRLFTLDEANQLLPRVRELLGSIQTHATRLTTLQQRLESFRAQKHRGNHTVDGEARVVIDAMSEAARISEEIRDLLAELQQIGCEVKDLQMGLVDFRSLRDDRVVYLCWRLGEDEIQYWHELDTGFAGRQPL